VADPRVPGLAAESEPLVVALVLNWRMADATLTCLADLRDAGYQNLEVLVLDNGSGPEQEELLKREVAGAELMLLGENLGYCVAMNRGIAWAAEQGADHVLFLNNDVRMPDRFLGPLVEVLQNDATLAAVGPTILSPNGKVWAQGAHVRFCPNLVRLDGQGRAPVDVTTGPHTADFLPGACVLYRLADLKAAGCLDESYFMYFEDADLGKRLRDRGRKLLWLPWVRVVHHASASSGGGRTPLRKYMMAANGVRYLRRHGSLRLWCAFVVFELCGWPFAFLFSGVRAGAAKMMGIIDGLLGHQVEADDVHRWAGS
jgi:GT2 family glycosyltransferase